VDKSSFIGNIPSKERPLHIVGGGFAGLSCAYYCQKNGIPFQLYEKEPATGGMLQTTSTLYGPAEAAANGFIWCREIAELAAQLDLTLLPPAKASSARYIVREGKLRRMPLSMMELLRTLKRMYTIPKASCETLADFGRHYFGEAATQHMMAPGISGIYGAPLEALSFKGTLPGLYNVQQQEGRFLTNMIRFIRERKKMNPRAFKGTWSLYGGMQTMTEAMSAFVSDHLQYKQIKTLRELPENEQVILCAPAGNAAEILQEYPEIASLLNQVKYLPLIAATLFFAEGSFSKIKKGFGCLVPTGEPCASRGILFNHDIFEGRVKAPAVFSLSFVLDSARIPGGIQADEAAIVKACMEDATYLLGVQKDPLEQVITRWPAALPVYSPDHMQLLEKLDGLLKEKLPHVSLLSNYTGEIALRGMLQSAAGVFDT